MSGSTLLEQKALFYIFLHFRGLIIIAAGKIGHIFAQKASVITSKFECQVFS